MTNESRKKQLEEVKLEKELRILTVEEKWVRWKMLTVVVIPIITLAALISGGIKYFLDERARLQIRMEEVYILGLKDLANDDELIRTGAVTRILGYVGREKGYDERVCALLAVHAVKERSVIVRQTILGNFLRWKKSDKKLFDEFLASIKSELKRVKVELKGRADRDERDALENQKKILHKVEQLLKTL